MTAQETHAGTEREYLECLVFACVQEFDNACCSGCIICIANAQTLPDVRMLYVIVYRCNVDSSRRVCAEIGDEYSSFFSSTGRSNWCGSFADNGNMR